MRGAGRVVCMHPSMGSAQQHPRDAETDEWLGEGTEVLYTLCRQGKDLLRIWPSPALGKLLQGCVLILVAGTRGTAGAGLAVQRY